MSGSGPSALHKIIYTIAVFVIKPAMKIKYGFKTDKVPDIKEPFILLSNHTTEDDMCFTAMAVRGHMYFVCGEHLLRNKLYGKLLRILIDPIPVPKGGASLEAVRSIYKRLKAGDNICMFPEGKRSFHGETIPSSVALGKLVKSAGCALVTYRIQGGYFTYPRWARKHHRKGHIEGHVVGVYGSNELSGMSAKEITDVINRDTYENAYETQRIKMWKYRGDNKAVGMEHILFICPKCKKMDTIRSDGDFFFCSDCGMNGKYNEYGFLEGKELLFDNVLSWMRWIEPEFDKYAEGFKDGELMYTEEGVLLYHMRDGYRNEDILTDTLKVYKDRMEIGTKDNGEAAGVFSYDDISSLSILYGNILLFTHNGVYYGLTGDRFRAWKCARLWHLIKGDTSDPSREI
ncbi:MAG: 1-acyl-sn-glycerol-3-phosphate acyltransferase [Lachnospiraceae bacterium]|nr:1-acyl-sn-glycerol-3-phosphate acyltransferase [Lachnospiraceae bacterium]